MVYDYLANELLLKYAPQAEKICVGKRAGEHSHTQEQINELLLELAQKHSLVLRLKGGDPFVFGRGGEEALELKKAGVPFEVLPGVTSGVAALAYAGIPLTQRGMATAAVFVTGQEKSGKPLSALTLKNLAKLDATLVFYMATAQASRICRALVAAGRKAETPAALVHKGTYPAQKVIVATLKSLPKEMERQKLGAPGLIVVGEVASLRASLRWFEDKPFFGKRVIATRAREQASRLASGLRDLGAEVMEAPSIRIKPLEPSLASLRQLPQCRWLIVTSSNGAGLLFSNLERAGMDARALHGVKVAAIGSSTAEALRQHGHCVADLVPESFVAEDLCLALAARDGKKLKGASVILARAREGRDALPALLKKAGAKVKELALYQTVADRSEAEAVSAAVLQGHLDWVTFTSSSTVKLFEAQLSPAARKAARKKLLAFCMGPITRATAEAAGYQVALESPKATIPDFLSAMEAYAARGKR